jgi:hypothetical protein
MMSSISVGRRPKRSHRAHCESQKDRFGNHRNFRVEFSGDGTDAKDQDEKIERVERPAQEASDESAALRRGEPAKVAEKLHAIFLRRDLRDASNSIAGTAQKTRAA